jgi:hypothetical protein
MGGAQPVGRIGAEGVIRRLRVDPGWRIALSLIRPTGYELLVSTWRDHHERKSILRGSGREREIRRGFWLGARHRDLHTNNHSILWAIIHGILGCST